MPFEGKKWSEAFLRIFVGSLYSCLKNSELQHGGVSEFLEWQNEFQAISGGWQNEFRECIFVRRIMS